MQPPAPALEFVFDWHGEQAEAPFPLEYVPASQRMQLEEVFAPTRVEYRPNEHEAQSLAETNPKDVENLPAGQALQTLDPLGLYHPIVQFTQETAVKTPAVME